MDLEDIPVLRHIPLAGGLLKAALLLFGWIIPLFLVFDYIERYKKRTYSQEAKWYYALRAIMWGAYAWAFSIISFGLLAGALNLPGPVSGNWVFITWIYCKLAGVNPDNYITYDCMFAFGFGIAMYAWSWYFGKENGSGDFITHESYEDGLRRLRADPLSPYDRAQADRAERKAREKN
ncbi:hypothetical protein H3H36_15645 [Duganella sp. FT3S]|uniref:Uncharacterized protein n=1 Tax=Rugamonas fusca TaxID=2758568 RepID=A0A7W2EJA9_9BURK|nr:hypothetical protein [Rugamonas fusca]MBA5606790.1 hypothetical protein [Rugamonas fusca]